MAGFKTLDDIGAVSGKRVLVRVDLNVPVADGKVTDATRIERIAPTIAELSKKGAKVILLAHFGRPKDGPSAEFSLEPIARAAADVLGRPVGFAADCVGDKAADAVAAMKDGDVLLLENTRFYKAEEKNEPGFTEKLAANGDIYVNDAFSAAHRAHASTEGLARHLPAYAGRTMQAELDALEKGLGNPVRPVVAIVGGAKVSSKIDLLMNLVKKVDALVIGGGMANTFLAARGTDVGKSLCEHDLAGTAKQIGRAGRRHDPRCRRKDRAERQRLDRPRRDAGLERAARRLRDRALRPRHGGGGKTCGGPHQGGQACVGRRRRRHGGRAQPCRRRRRLHLCLDRRRRFPRMDGRQAAARRRGAEALSRQDLASGHSDRGLSIDSSFSGSFLWQ